MAEDAEPRSLDAMEAPEDTHTHLTNTPIHIHPSPIHKSLSPIHSSHAGRWRRTRSCATWTFLQHFYSISTAVTSLQLLILQLLISCAQVAEDVELRNLEAMEALEDLDDVDAVFTNMA